MNLDNNCTMFRYIGQSAVKDERSIAVVEQTTIIDVKVMEHRTDESCLV